MRKFKWYYLGLVLLAVVVGYFSLTFWVKHKIESALQQEVRAGQLTYSNLYINILKGQLELDSVRYQSRNNVLKVAQFRVAGISALTYGIRFVLAVDEVSLKGVELQLHPGAFSTKHKRKIPFDFPVEIQQLRLDSLSLTYSEDDNLQLKLDDYTLAIDQVRINPQEKTWPERVSLSTYALHGNQLFYKLSKLQFLKLDSLSITPDQARFYQLNLDSDYTPQNYVSVISTERDLMHLHLPELAVKNYFIDVFEEEPVFTADTIVLEQPDFSIYRDKLVADDWRPKKMYSQMLRELPIQLAVKQLLINQGKITYRERQEKTKRVGQIYFTKIDAVMTALDNTAKTVKTAPQTKVDISARFMGHAPLYVKWRFNIADKTDAFRIYGSSKSIAPTAVNSFLTPAFNLQMDGDNINSMYFDFEGDAYQARGKFKMTYENLKVNVLKKNGKRKNKVLSFVANIFVHKNRSQTQKQVEVTAVKRDKTKSFWNYFWNCIFAGLKKTVI